MVPQNRITCHYFNCISLRCQTLYQPYVKHASGHEKNLKKKNQYQLWGLASKPITTLPYQ